MGCVSGLRGGIQVVCGSSEGLYMGCVRGFIGSIIDV